MDEITIIDVLNETNIILTETNETIRNLETYIGFMTVLLIIITFVLIRRRGHKKIM